jgi:hypothetical protein
MDRFSELKYYPTDCSGQCDHAKLYQRNQDHQEMLRKWFRKVENVLHLFKGQYRVVYAEGDTCETSRFILRETNIPPEFCVAMTYLKDFRLPKGSFIDECGFNVSPNSMLECEFPAYDHPDYALMSDDGMDSPPLAGFWMDGTTTWDPIAKKKQTDLSETEIRISTRYAVFGFIDQYASDQTVLMVTLSTRKSKYQPEDILNEIEERAQQVGLRTKERETLRYTSAVHCVSDDATYLYREGKMTGNKLFLAVQFEKI